MPCLAMHTVNNTFETIKKMSTPRFTTSHFITSHCASAFTKHYYKVLSCITLYYITPYCISYFFLLHSLFFMNEKQKSILQRTLLRNDPDYKELLNFASHVSLYSYDTIWSEADVEGPLYIYSTETLPVHRLIIFNRKLNNVFLMPLDNCSYFEAENFIAISFENITYGIWFFDLSDYKKISSLLKKISNLRSMSKELIGSLQKGIIKK